MGSGKGQAKRVNVSVFSAPISPAMKANAQLFRKLDKSLLNKPSKAVKEAIRGAMDDPDKLMNQLKEEWEITPEFELRKINNQQVFLIRDSMHHYPNAFHKMFLSLDDDKAMSITQGVGKHIQPNTDAGFDFMMLSGSLNKINVKRKIMIDQRKGQFASSAADALDRRRLAEARTDLDDELNF